MYDKSREWLFNVPLKDLTFTETPNWFQVHGLVPSKLNAKNVKLIRDLVGTFLEVDMTQEGILSILFFLKIWSSISLDKTLFTGFHNEKLDRTKHWVHFKYEKLLDFCFLYGFLRHQS